MHTISRMVKASLRGAKYNTCETRMPLSRDDEVAASSRRRFWFCVCGFLGRIFFEEGFRMFGCTAHESVPSHSPEFVAVGHSIRREARTPRNARRGSYTNGFVVVVPVPR